MNRPAPTDHVIRVALASAPSNLDPRLATDDFSVKTSQLIFGTLMGLDERLQVVPQLAERLDHPTPVTWVATLRQGVRFHDGHELTSDDVVFTFRCLIDPDFVSPRKGGYRELQSVDPLDRYTVLFTLKEPFPSFPVYLVLPIVPAGVGPRFAEHPVGTGPYRFVRYLADDRIELRAFPDHYAGRPANDGIILRVVPDDVMRGLELRKGTVDVVVNDLAPDIVRQLRTDGRLRTVEAPGVDYQYIGLNVSDPILASVRVRRALAYAIDRAGIVEHLRQGLAVPAAGMMPRLSWAIASDLPVFPTDPARARTLLDEAGYPDPDGDGPAARFHLTLKVSSTEFNRLQSAVIQENLQRVGIALDVRTYDFATMYADVLSGNFQLFTMQWTGESLADPDILRRVFHSAQTPPVGFNRGRFVNARLDALLDSARTESNRERRRTLYGEAQRLIADEVPYISLWHKTNVAVAQRSLSGVRLSPLGDFTFLKDVSRVEVAHAN
jgi:peptide/nickel transport system substrate-binding protein